MDAPLMFMPEQGGVSPEEAAYNQFEGMPQAQKPSDDFSRWQLDTKHGIEEIGKRLLGLKESINVETGEIVWEPQPEEEATLTKEGVSEVITQMGNVTNKNIYLSNLKEEIINRFTKQIVGNIIIRLGTDTKLYGIKDASGVDDPTKLHKVKDLVEPTIYAALCRANKWKTLDSVNKAHEIRELRTNQERQGWKAPWAKQ